MKHILLFESFEDEDISATFPILKFNIYNIIYDID